MHDEDNPFEDETVEVTSHPGAGIDLGELDTDYVSTEAQSTAGIPDGKYHARIEKVELTTTKAKGLPMIKYDLIVMSGEHTGRHVFKNSVITKNSLSYLKGDFNTLELNLDKLSDFEGRMAELLDKVVEITKRTKGDNSNVYFNKLIKTPSEDSEAFGDTSGVF